MRNSSMASTWSIACVVPSAVTLGSMPELPPLLATETVLLALTPST
jgi:hypothetical protein